MAAMLVEKRLQEADFREDEALAFPLIRSFRQRMLLFSPQEDTASCRILWAKTNLRIHVQTWKGCHTLKATAMNTLKPRPLLFPRDQEAGSSNVEGIITHRFQRYYELEKMFQNKVDLTSHFLNLAKVNQTASNCGFMSILGISHNDTIISSRESFKTRPTSISTSSTSQTLTYQWADLSRNKEVFVPLMSDCPWRRSNRPLLYLTVGLSTRSYY